MKAMLSSAILIAICSTALGQYGTLIDLPFDATDVSGDGSTVIGEFAGECYYWRLDEGAVNIGPGRLTDVSFDGSLIVGDHSNLPFTWTSATGRQPVAIPAGFAFENISLIDTGIVLLGRFNALPAIWTAGDGITTYDLPGPGKAFDITDDASVVFIKEYVYPTSRTWYHYNGDFVQVAIHQSGCFHCWQTSLHDFSEVGNIWVTEGWEDFSGNASTSYNEFGASGTIGLSEISSVSPTGDRFYRWNSVRLLAPPYTETPLFQYLTTRFGVDLSNQGWLRVRFSSHDNDVVVGSRWHAGAYVQYVLVAPPPCPDIDNNGVVDGADLNVLLTQWGCAGQGCGDADLNEDGDVDGADLNLLLSAWGPCD